MPKSILKLLAAGTVIIFLISSNLLLPKIIFAHDFCQEFYPVGLLIRQKKANIIYPDLNTTDLKESQFNTYVHQLYPSLPKNLYCPYFYPPLNGLLFVPFTFLKPNIAELAWVIFNWAILILCLRLTRIFDQDLKNKFYYLDLFISLIIYGPIIATLWVGQCGIIYGILPICLGLYFWIKNSTFKASLCWSLCALKPQYLIIPIFIISNYLLNNKYRLAGLKMLFGLVTGCFILILLNFVFFGQSLLAQFLHCLSINVNMDQGVNSGIPYQLYISLPGSLIPLLTEHNQYKSYQYIGLILVVLANILISAKIMMNRDFNTNFAKIILLTLSAFNLVFIATHLLYYDLVIFVFIYSFITLFNNKNKLASINNKLAIQLQNLLKFTVYSINFYGLLIVFNKTIALPGILISLLLYLYIMIVIASFKYRT